MKEMLRYGLILMLICSVASGALAVVNQLTRQRIITQALAEEEASLKEVLPQAARFEPVKKDGETDYYKGFDAGGSLVGLAFKAQGKGYSSLIETVAGMRPDGTITAIKVVGHNETPGLGSKVAEAKFTGRFVNKPLKDVDGVRWITGATISSRAVIDSVKRRTAELLPLIRR